jgi:hypothetical protein
MNLANISQRLEISFWIVVVTLMKDKRVLRFAPAALISSLCLVMGALMVVCTGYLHIASRRAKGHEPVDSIPKPRAIAMTDIDNGQHNVLVILADQLNAEPLYLEGVWLVVYLPSTSQLTFLPLYPSSLSEGAYQDNPLVSLFRLGPGGAPAPVFLKALREEKNVWWDNFLVLDETALTGMVDALGGIDLGLGCVNGAQAVANLSPKSREPREALVEQATLARGLCFRAPELFWGANPVGRFDLHSGHVFSDLAFDGSTLYWPGLGKNVRNLSCEFPTLQEVSLSLQGD